MRNKADPVIEYHIDDAVKGNAEAAKRLLMRARLCIQDNEPFPPALKEYFLSAFTQIIDGNSADEALLLKRRGRKRTYASDYKAIEITEYIIERMKQGASLSKACDEVYEKGYGVGRDRAEQIYKKWHRAIKNRQDKTRIKRGN